MKKDDILNASRKEHKNKDLAEIEVIYQAGSHAGRVGALHCFVLERDRYGSYHPTGSSCWFGIYALWTVQI